MAGAVVDEGDELVARADGGRRAQFVDESADEGDDFKIGAGCVAAEVIGFSGAAMVEEVAEGGTGVTNIEPVADVEAVAIDGEGLAFKGIEDGEGDEFLRKLEGSVVIGEVGGDDGQAPGVMEGAGKVVSSGF